MKEANSIKNIKWEPWEQRHMQADAAAPQLSLDTNVRMLMSVEDGGSVFTARSWAGEGEAGGRGVPDRKHLF